MNFNEIDAGECENAAGSSVPGSGFNRVCGSGFGIRIPGKEK